MNKTIATLVVMLLLSAGSCTPFPAERPEPLVLPYPLYDQNFRGNQVTVALEADPESSATAQCMYRFTLNTRLAEGETTFGVYVIPKLI